MSSGTQSMNVAPKDCPKCKSRRISCDRTLPKCRKCASRSFDCPGYGLILRWTQGVASRGKLTGRCIPVAEDGRESVRGASRTRQQDKGLRGAMPLAPLDRGIQHPFDYISCQLLRHFDQSIAVKLAWIDGPENPWRRIILPLSHESPIVLYSVLAMAAEELAHRYTTDRFYFHRWQTESLRYRDKVLSLLPQHLDRLLNTPVSLECSNQAQYVLASVILLYNLELLTAQASQWRLHIQGARAIIQWKMQALHRHRPPDIADDFLRYEYYFTAVFNGLTTFDAAYDILDDVPKDERIARSGFKFTRDSNGSAVCVGDITRELEAARCRTLAQIQTIQFQDQDARHDFEHLTHMYYHASLIYSHRVLSDYASSEEYFAQDLVWLLFVCGTECRGLPDQQDIIVRALLGVIHISGNLDRRRVLSFLRMYWQLDLVDREVSWIHVARTRQADCSFMII
ncbi:Zn(II)2Cys6 transcription factor [Aspergillus alliaceus]|uniref:Zn(II)2Cys6 transcription factor n=1 Tax=Petromyces alliaceus TaxID=209559 RepID=UPI0012A528A1|nr:fungal-specific transcription factor domain-containing protein [Aspergillus alliaceus]KAB8232391.1 fungal-specific transcription factor domain-containing protein [Aspergillus alliaceus]